MFSKKKLSMDIGSSDIKLVVGKYVNNIVVLYDAISIHTPPDSFQDGEIIDMIKLKGVIHSILKSKKIDVKQVIFSVASTNIITRELLLPSTNMKKFEQMLEYEIQQQFPMSLNEYVIQYKKVEEINNTNIKRIRILVEALPIQIARNYFELAKLLSLKPYALDSQSNIVSKLFYKNIKINDLAWENRGKEEPNTISVIDLGYANIKVNIIENNILRFSRILTTGGRNIDLDISNNLGISLEEVEEKKKFFRNVPKNHIESLEFPIILDIVKNNVDVWLDEIERIFMYYTSRRSENRIDKIYLLGGYANIIGIIDIIEKHFGIPVCIIEKMSNVQTNKLNNEFDLKVYINAVGAIIRK